MYTLFFAGSSSGLSTALPVPPGNFLNLKISFWNITSGTRDCVTVANRDTNATGATTEDQPMMARVVQDHMGDRTENSVSHTSQKHKHVTKGQGFPVAGCLTHPLMAPRALEVTVPGPISAPPSG